MDKPGNGSKRGGKKGKGRGKRLPAGGGRAEDSQSSLPSAKSDASSLASEVSQKLTVRPSPRDELSPMKRPDYGGKLHQGIIELISNHCEIKFTGKTLVYQYDVVIEPLRDDGRVARRRLSREDCHKLFWRGFVNNLEAQFPAAAEMIYDQSKQLYSLKPVIPIKDSAAGMSEDIRKLEFQVRFSELDGDRNRNPLFRLTISSTNNNRPIEVGDFYSAYHAGDNVPKLVLELLFRQGLYFNDSFFSSGRNFYFSNNEDCIDLGCGREIRRGWYQAVRLISNWRVTFTLDVKAAIFYQPENCVDIVRRLLNSDRLPQELNQHQILLLNKEIKGLKLKATHIGHTIACSGLSQETALTAKFTHKEQTVTVDQYFRDEYRIDLHYKRWPLIMKGRGQSARLFPLEVCRIADRQRLPLKKITDDQQAKMVKSTAVAPEVRQRLIGDTLKQMKMDVDEHLLKYGVSVNMKPIEPKGRILEPPKLQYRDKTPVQPMHGSWNMSSNKLYSPSTASLKSLSVICIASQRFCPERDIRQYCWELGKQARNVGLWNESALQANFPIRYVDVRQRSWIDQIEQVFEEAKNNRCQLVFVIMDGKNAEVYAAVKKFGEQKCDIVSQCVQVKKVKDVVNQPQKNAGVLSNICLKLNAKMGGINVKLADAGRIKEFLTQPVLFVGADVSHPDPGDKLSPSIVGIATNLDNVPGRYRGKEMLQKHRKESIENFDVALKEGLLAYYKATKAKPNRIIVYRDGVSEGQFSDILRNEMVAVQNACMKLQEDYKPSRTFIIVQKRHNTRLFLKHQPPQRGRVVRNSEKNIPPGTTVDTDIVHPEEFDFYLSSHEGIQGTSKPTHYHVLYDDNGFSSDSLQQLTYYLCHTYARCTRSVSLPAPVYYAHHIAARARMRLRAVFDSEESRTADSLSEDQLAALTKQIQVGENTQNVMYWQ